MSEAKVMIEMHRVADGCDAAVLVDPREVIVVESILPEDADSAVAHLTRLHVRGVQTPIEVNEPYGKVRRRIENTLRARR